MNRAVEQALTSLVPALHALPPELVDLAVSLLAQSHGKASSLKPDEEAARTYACAHLACERSKQKLRLPTIAPRPPCPPRIYKKLLAYLDSALASTKAPRAAAAAAPPTTSTPSTPAKAAAAAVAAKPTPPATDANAAPTPAPRSSGATTRAHAATDSLRHDDAIGPHMRLIRRLCDAVYDCRPAIPHVCAGVRSILQAQTRHGPYSYESTRSARGRKRRGRVVEFAIDERRVPCLVVAVLLLVKGRLKGGTGVDAVDWVGDASVCLHGKPDVLAEFGLLDGGVFAEMEDVLELAGQKWLGMEWYLNIGVDAVAPDALVDPLRADDGEGDELAAVFKSMAGAEPKGKKRKRDVEPTDGNGMLYAGPGTMFCPAVDWLSDERRAHYQVWRRNILAEIDDMSKAKGEGRC